MSKTTAKTDTQSLLPVQKFLEIVKSGKKLPDLQLESPTPENINMLDKTIESDTNLSPEQVAHIKKISRKTLIKLYTNNENFDLNKITSEEEQKRFKAIDLVLPRIDNEELRKGLKAILLNPDLDCKQSLTMASVHAFRAGFKEESGILDTFKGVYSNNPTDKNLDEALDKEIKSHSPEYIALKFKGKEVDFNELITKCSAESAHIILKAAEKQQGMEDSPPSKWRELLIEFSDFCKNRGKKVGVDKMRIMLENKSNPTHSPVFSNKSPGTPRDMDL